MQLCPYMDLRTFINKRRSNPSMTSKSSIRPSIPVKNQDSHMFLVDDLEGPKLFEDYDDTEEENNPTRTINLYLFKQIVEGLMHIHEQHVVHRDIKPDNIFVQENYNVLVGDFGLAKSLASHAVNNLADSPEPETDETGTASTDEGTFFYMAPELLDQHIYTAKSDIYSLGIILLELFHPFSTEMERIMLLTELKKNPLSLAHFCSASGMPSDVSHLLSRLLSVDPSKRPSAMEIILDPLFDNFASQQLGIRSPLATSPNHSVSLNTNSFLSMRRPSSSFTLRPGSMRSDHLHLRQRASSTTITGNFAHRSSSGSPSDPIGSGVASFIGPRSLPSYKFPAHTTEDDDESSMSTSSKPPYVPHPRSSSFDLSNGNDTVELIGLGESIHEGMEKKEEAPKQTNAFAQLWGMIKNVTKPKSGSSNEGLGSAGSLT
ncbi:kinase-like protein [Rhizoclosmatium globosum]|uniref:Kinase-like protein n=1 Tax=Rhizoclosmatium globosum TaxID=329046 RepID=A0A1Y2BUU3_9FUNG|nr:kinase-like protein [Rhizoclosmatium globosum]|eukprot:ORY38548.1 kinase-like protein [Rhizoclosmatium globosum]